jgi:hypothetical protein
VFRIVGDKDCRTSKFGYTTGLFPYRTPEIPSYIIPYSPYSPIF